MATRSQTLIIQSYFVVVSLERILSLERNENKLWRICHNYGESLLDQALHVKRNYDVTGGVRGHFVLATCHEYSCISFGHDKCAI